jgi:hypothetical protein
VSLPPSYEPIDPLDTSYNDHHDTHDINDIKELNDTVTDNKEEPKGKKCPKADIAPARRSSVDVGGLHISLTPESADIDHGNGSGWAGWDSSPPRVEFDEEKNELE